MKIKYIPLKKLREIRDGDFTSPTGKEYWDYQDQILERISLLQERGVQEMFDKREKEELDYQFHNFSLEDPDTITWAYSNFEKLINDRFYQ